MAVELAQTGAQALSWLHVGDWNTFWVQLTKIIGIDIVLAGDNAVVIALACRALPPRQKFWGIILGAGAAVVLRVIFTVTVTQLLGLPWLKLIGGILLLWVAIKLINPKDADEHNVAAGGSLWEAVKIVTIADVVMSLDNVLAIAAAAQGNTLLIILGLLISIPLVVAGATLIMALLTRFPILVWAGAALLGWVAGELLITEKLLAPYFDQIGLALGIGDRWMHRLVSAAGALFVVGVGWLLSRGRSREQVSQH